MKRLIALLLATIPALHSTCGQNIEGQLIASQYGQWRVQGYAPDTYTFAPTSCRVQGGASSFYAFTAGTPVRIVDGNPALSETVTPSSVVENNNTCSISINPVNHHQMPFYLTSATGGLQEAIHANRTDTGTNTIILNNAWYRLGGSSSVIAEVAGVAELGLVDVTTLPSTWYRWDGSQYVAVPTGSDITSVFGRTGAVTAQNGDYNCTQVTNCPTSFVGAFNGRSGSVTPQAGDYTCTSVTDCVPNAVPSVFGRTGAITAQDGDYTCDQVTGCGPITGWSGLLTAAQGVSDTTASVNVIAGVLPESGYFFIDSEWEHFSGFASLGNDNYTLTGVTRGKYLSTAAGHSSAAQISSMIQPLAPDSETNFAWTGGTQTTGYFLSVNCPFGNSFNDEIFVEIGCPDSGFDFFSSGSFASTTTGQNYIAGSLSIGSGGIPFDLNLEDADFPILHSGQVLQTGVSNQFMAAVGFGSGISGSVKAVQPPSAQAPLLKAIFVPAGSTTYTYQCNGVDEDGNNIPGTPASLANQAASGWPGDGVIYITCAPIPGATNITIWRTAGGPNTGLLATLPGASAVFEDHYATATSGSPNPVNTVVPKICTNGEQWCAVSGTGNTPPYTCSSTRQGWEYHNVSATATPFVQICNGTSWVAAY